MRAMVGSPAEDFGRTRDHRTAGLNPAPLQSREERVTQQDLQEQLVEAVLGLLRPEVERMINERVERRLPKPSPWLTAEQAGHYLSVTAHTVRQRVYAGKLKAHYDSGGTMRFLREDLDASVT